MYNEYYYYSLLQQQYLSVDGLVVLWKLIIRLPQWGSAVTFRVFPVPEPLRLGPGEPTAPPGAPPIPYTVGEVAPARGQNKEWWVHWTSELWVNLVISYCLTGRLSVKTWTFRAVETRVCGDTNTHVNYII